jgi:tRNA (guanine-N7-)-methyltransferase
VLREGRMTEGQRRAFDRLWPRFGVAHRPGSPLDLPSLFGNRRPVYLEIGFGNGDALAAASTAHPDRNYLGVEVHRPGIGHLLLELERRDLRNVRLLRGDAAEVLEDMPPRCLEGVWLFFPDPWPKQRHHKRRLVQPALVARLARVLRPGGTLHMATDWEDYGAHMLRCLSANPGLANTTPGSGFAARPEDRPLTRFEERGRRLGHGVWDLVFVRV